MIEKILMEKRHLNWNLFGNTFEIDCWPLDDLGYPHINHPWNWLDLSILLDLESNPQSNLEPDPIKIISTLKVSSWNSPPRFCTCCQTHWFWPLPKMWFRYWAMAFEITTNQSVFYRWGSSANEIIEPMKWKNFDKAIKGPSNAWHTRIRGTWSFGIWTGWSWSWHVVNWGHHLYSSFWLFPVSRFVTESFSLKLPSWITLILTLSTLVEPPNISAKA